MRQIPTRTRDDRMADEKRKVGRPRKYESRAERQKAYHERKKKKLTELEHKVEQLGQQKQISFEIETNSIENRVFKEIQTLPWRKITASEIALMGIQELKLLIDEFRGRIQQESSFESSLENITLGILSKNHFETIAEPDEEIIADLNRKIKENVRNLEDRMQQQTLLYLMEAEFASRKRLDKRNTKLDLFEARIEELEKESKKVEIKKKIQ